MRDSTRQTRKHEERETDELILDLARILTFSNTQLTYSSSLLNPIQSSNMALELWQTLKEAITVYTGLSPATFFTLLAVGLALYYVVSGLFGSSSSPSHHQGRSFQEPMEPLPPPVQIGEISEDELKEFDGTDPKKPLLMAIKSQIYDVSQSRMFYGPGGPYALFAGKDASRALAKMSFEEKDLTGDVSGLGPFEMDALQDWEYKFMSKYVKVGTVKKPEEPSSSGVTEAAENDAPLPSSEAEAVAAEESVAEAVAAVESEEKKDE